MSTKSKAEYESMVRESLLEAQSSMERGYYATARAKLGYAADCLDILIDLKGDEEAVIFQSIEDFVTKVETPK